LNAQSTFRTTFVDLISNYKKKGYKVKDLSLKNNLFEPSPLLLENDKIVRYFPLGDNTKCYNKDLKFVNILNSSLNDRIQRDERRHSIFYSDDFRIEDMLLLNEYKNKTTQDLVNEIEKNEEAAAKSKSLLESGDYQHLFDLKANTTFRKNLLTQRVKFQNGLKTAFSTRNS
jgi:hypothetical protein